MTDGSISSSCRRGNEHTNRCKKKKKARRQLQVTAWCCIYWQAKSMTEQKMKTDANQQAQPQSHSLKDTVTLRLSQHPDARNYICSFGEKCKVRLQVQRWLQNKTCVSHMHARVCSWLSVQLWGWVYLSVWDDTAWNQRAKGWGVSIRRPGKSRSLFWSRPPF